MVVVIGAEPWSKIGSGVRLIAKIYLTKAMRKVFVDGGFATDRSKIVGRVQCMPGEI